MSYVVLARKHRPMTFDELIGQEHVAKILKKAIEHDRIHHAYLFCGPRGIGKTSCARILAACLNDENGPTLAPDYGSDLCKEIVRGSSLDVLEIDGASNRGIDEIRMIRENVKFAPSYGRFKIYIVDEVHMLTSEAFNALLKTLEEPPPHVKFMFATTEPNKVPATIISRCQRFDFKRIPIRLIVETLEAVSAKENINIDAEALYAIAKAGQGSMRDALSILDQVSALTDEGVRAGDVFSMLGMVETDLLFDLSEQLGRKNCVEALQAFEEILGQGKDIKQLVKDLIEHYRNLMMIKIGGKSLGKMVDYPAAIKEMYLTQCGTYSLKDILTAIDMLIEAQETSRVTESLRLPVEVAFAKMTCDFEALGKVPQDTPKPEPARTRKTPGSVPASEKTAPPKPSQPDQATVPGGAATEKDSGDPADEPVRFSLEDILESWDGLTHAVSRKRMSLATYLQEATPVRFQGDKLVLGLPQAFSFHKEALEDKDAVDTVSRIFTEKLKTPVYVSYIFLDEEGHEVTAKKEDPLIEQALKTFGGQVVSRWHNDDGTDPKAEEPPNQEKGRGRKP